MKAYTMSARALTENANQIKEVFLQEMVKEKHITKKKQTEMNGYCLVIAEKSFFGKLWNKVFWKGSDADRMSIVVVKVVN